MSSNYESDFDNMLDKLCSILEKEGVDKEDARLFLEEQGIEEHFREGYEEGYTEGTFTGFVCGLLGLGA